MDRKDPDRADGAEEEDARGRRQDKGWRTCALAVKILPFPNGSESVAPLRCGHILSCIFLPRCCLSSGKLHFSPVWFGDDRFILVSDVTSCFGRVGTFVATGILPLAEQSPLNEVMIIMCMSSKADKLCDSKHMVKVSFVRLYVSFVQLFLSHDMVYAY